MQKMSALIIRKTGLGKWRDALVMALIPFVVAGFIYFKSQIAISASIVLVCLAMAVLFPLIEAGDFTEIEVLEDSIIVKQLLKRQTQVSLDSIQEIRSWNISGRYIRPSMKVLYKDPAKKAFSISHKFSNAVLTELFQALTEKGVAVIIYPPIS